LIDTAPDGVAEQVAELVGTMPEVARIGRVRARPAGASIFVELVVKVGRGLPLEQVESLKDAIRKRIDEQMPNVDVLVVAEPLTLDNEDVTETVRVAAACQGVGVHDIGIYILGGKRHVGFDMEVDESLKVREAHDLATALEWRLVRELGGEVCIDIYINPRRVRITDGDAVGHDEQVRIQAAIGETVRANALVQGFHRVFLQRGPDGIYVAFHCTFPGDAPIKAVHSATVHLEADLRHRIDGVSRVVIHAEPEDHDDGAPSMPRETIAAT